jgi:protein-L-isoaspartate(D-aspartate) O-methyltransferase
MIDLSARRRFFAEEVQMVGNIRSASVVEALASVPREQFLPPGPWMVRSEADFGAPPRQTEDADPRHVYHNIAIGIEPARMLFNGAPSLVGMAIDALGVKPGDRVMHVGSGTGYFTAILAHCAGAGGRVLAFEVDGGLAARATSNLSSMPWVEVRPGDGTGDLQEPFDAILVNAGVTHPLASWLDALSHSGRIVIPLTATAGAMGNIGKGLMLLLRRTADPQTLDVRLLTFVAIFSAVGVRDDALNGELAKVMAQRPFGPIKRFRRDPHERTDACWLHGSGICFSCE